MSSKITLSIPKMTVTPTDEKYMEIEKRYCRFFGCAKRLSLIESLCGDFCERHMNLKKHIFYNGLL